MEITSRANHMWQSSYVPLGLDATVSYPYLDFQFKNPTEYPVYIVAGMTGTKVTVTLYGYQPPDYDNIEVVSQQTGTVAQPEDQFVVDSSLKKGEKVLDRKGNAGIRASAKRIFYLNGKVVKTEALPSSYYRAIANIYKVGPGTEGTTSSTPASSAAASSKPERTVFLCGFLLTGFVFFPRIVSACFFSAESGIFRLLRTNGIGTITAPQRAFCLLLHPGMYQPAQKAGY